jgi:hypothetical protein
VQYNKQAGCLFSQFQIPRNSRNKSFPLALSIEKRKNSPVVGTVANKLPEPHQTFVSNEEKEMNRGGFSWNRFIGISAAKSRISRSIGIPLTKGGRERKIGRMVTGGGCLVVIGLGILITVVLTILVVKSI